MAGVKIFNNRQEALTAVRENVPRLLVVDGTRICLIRREEELLAVEDRCPHNGESLAKGKTNYLGEIICPWHGYRFSMVTGREAEERCRDLVTFPIRETEEGVFIFM